MSNRSIYMIMAAITLVAVLGLWFLVKGSDDDAPKATTAAAPGSAQSGFTGPGHGPAASPGGPALPVESGSAGELPAKVKEYAANGAIIRDHRSGTHETFEGGSDATPANTRTLQTALTKAVADKVRDAVHECAAQVPASARGEDSRLEGSINIAIKDNKVVVNQANINVRGVTDGADAARACIVQKSLAITQPAGDEADLASYDINLSLSLI